MYAGRSAAALVVMTFAIGQHELVGLRTSTVPGQLHRNWPFLL